MQSFIRSFVRLKLCISGVTREVTGVKITYWNFFLWWKVNELELYNTLFVILHPAQKASNTYCSNFTLNAYVAKKAEPPVWTLYALMGGLKMHPMSFRTFVILILLHDAWGNGAWACFVFFFCIPLNFCAIISSTFCNILGTNNTLDPAALQSKQLMEQLLFWYPA